MRILSKKISFNQPDIKQQDKISLFSEYYRNNRDFNRWVNQKNIPSISDFITSLASLHYKETENAAPLTPLDNLREHPDKTPQEIIFPREVNFSKESVIPGYGLAPFHGRCPTFKEGKMKLLSGEAIINNIPKSEVVYLNLKNHTGSSHVQSPGWLDIEYIDDFNCPLDVKIKVKTNPNGEIWLGTFATLSSDKKIPEFSGYSVERCTEEDEGDLPSIVFGVVHKCQSN